MKGIMNHMARNREKKFQIYITDEEREKIKAKAEYCNLDMSKYGRKMLLDGAIINLTTFEYMDVIKELTSIADSVRNIEKEVCEKGIGEEELRDLKQQVKKLSTLYVEKIVGGV